MEKFRRGSLFFLPSENEKQEKNQNTMIDCSTKCIENYAEVT
jgi:hypothetical protein